MKEPTLYPNMAENEIRNRPLISVTLGTVLYTGDGSCVSVPGVTPSFPAGAGAPEERPSPARPRLSLPPWGRILETAATIPVPYSGYSGGGSCVSVPSVTSSFPADAGATEERPSPARPRLSLPPWGRLLEAAATIPV